MLIAEGGGGYGGTDWNSKDVRYMWSAIADQETTTHYDVVSGWRQTADLTLTHLGQVQMYRDNLASVWPPSKSPAAAAYLERLDKLIADLRATHEAASANYTAFSTVTLTLSLARNKLKPLLEQYETNEKANLTWQAEQDAKPVDPSKPPTISFPPVSSAQQEQLNNEARVIMYDLSSTVLSGQGALQKPKPYDPAQYARDDATTSGDGSGSGSGFATPPVIPPPGGMESQSSASSSRPSQTSGTHLGPTTNTPIAPGHAGFPVGNGGGGNGPILGGIGTSPVTSPPTSLPQPVGNPAPPLTSTSPGLAPGVIAPPPPGSAPVPGGSPTGGGRSPQGGMLRPGTGGVPAGRMTMPSGGVIGATPGSGLIGQMPATGAGSRPPAGTRVNPVGGVIGQPGVTPAAGAPGRPVAGAATPHASGQPMTRAARGRSNEDSERTHWDPDNPWATDEGVDPVVLPPRDPGPIDPGPAIGIRR